MPASPWPFLKKKELNAGGVHGEVTPDIPFPCLSSSIHVRLSPRLHELENKYSSFQRQLNLYGFRKLVRGNEAGGYMHPLFERGKPEQLSQVRRGFFPEVGYLACVAMRTCFSRWCLDTRPFGE